MQKLTSVLLILFLNLSVMAQFPSNVTTLNVVPNQEFSVKGNLSSGEMMSDLSWASSSQIACFPATQNTKFTGNHVLYSMKIPEHAEVFITVIPDDERANFSIYAYSIGTTNYSTVPDLARCVSCEAEHKWDYPKKGKTQNHTRTVRLNAITKPYNIVIGVVGAEGLVTGGYTLKIDLKAAVQNTNEQLPVKRYTAECVKGETKSYRGDLSQGTIIYDLSWASKSSVACFPATQNNKFNGNHLLFLTEMPARSRMTITLIPDDKNANMSLYAYSAGTFKIVPDLNSCVSCEADHKWDYPKRGKTQNHTRSVMLNGINPYKVVIGVAGADGLKEGTFIIQIKVEEF